MLLGVASAVNVSAVIVSAGLAAASWLVGPLFLALVIVITVYPVQTWLRRAGVPGRVATTLLVLLVYAVSIGLTGMVVNPRARWVEALIGTARPRPDAREA